MEKYEELKIEIIVFDCEDIITVSDVVVTSSGDIQLPIGP